MNSLLLFSGGADSTLCLLKFLPKVCLGVDYNQEHKVELEYAEKLCEENKVLFVKVSLGVTLPLINDVVYAGRNLVLLSLGVAYAQSLNLDSIIIGCNKSDHERFPDCRKEFLESINQSCRSAYGVSVLFPLIDHEKRQIIQELTSFHSTETWTCYKPIGKNIPCGVCYACVSLNEAKKVIV